MYEVRLTTKACQYVSNFLCFWVAVVLNYRTPSALPLLFIVISKQKNAPETNYKLPENKTKQKKSLIRTHLEGAVSTAGDR